MFAKLFETPDGQLLVTHEFDDGEYPEAPYRLSFRGEPYQGADPAISFGWATEAERDEAFTATDQARADNTARELAAIVSNFMADPEDAALAADLPKQVPTWGKAE